MSLCSDLGNRVQYGDCALLCSDLGTGVYGNCASLCSVLGTRVYEDCTLLRSGLGTRVYEDIFLFHLMFWALKCTESILYCTFSGQ